MKGRGGSKVVWKFSENSSILGKWVFPKLQENECTTCYISYICYIQGGHWGSEDYRLPVFFTILSTNYRLFNTLSTNFIDVYFQDILPWNRPGTWLSTQLDFHLKKFAHFWMWHDEKAKMGLSLYVYYKFAVLSGSYWWLCSKNLQNIQNYRLNYRLFGKLTTI